MQERDLTYIIQAHTQKAKKLGYRFRKWDNKTPYYVHPIWCASMIRQEPSLPEEIRVRGSQALLYHDVLEDTTATLPDWLSDEVRTLVSNLTFESSEDEWEKLWQRSEQVRLLKLYDKVSNMMDSSWMKPERRNKHLAHLRKLCENVEQNYGNLNITRLARTFL
jgi:(p)ppGpp synthase/HD superfamily hydrolase